MSVKPGVIVGRESFIRRLSKNLGRSELTTTPPIRIEKGVPAFYADRQLTKQEMLDLFIQHWTTLTGKVLLVSEADAGPATRAFLRQVCEEHEVESVVRWEHEGLIQLGLDAHLVEHGIRVVPWKAEMDQASTPLPMESNPDKEVIASNWSQRSPLLQAAEQSRLGVVWADFALAETGSVVLCAQGGNGRSVSLLPEVLFAVFRADRLVRRMGEAFSAMAEDERYSHIWPSSVNIITGPSRSADIENDLTIGIHGPGKVYAVIIE
ncbi:MAG: LUD domain-containing protein [Paenibacillaceae bacterium]